MSTETPEQPFEQPTQGGSYTRQPDGSLQLVQRTAPAQIGEPEPANPEPEVEA